MKELAFNPLFSVVIPLHNKAPYIEKTVRSVLGQTFSNHEIIIIDDGSTDDSLAIVQKMTIDSRVRIIRQGNRGVSAARNRGVEAAKGSYIAFLDADDFWMPERLNDLRALIGLYPSRPIYSTSHILIRNNIRRRKYKPSIGYIYMDENKFLKEFSRNFSLINSSTACLKKETIQEIGGFPEGVAKGEDVIVWMKAVREGGLAYSGSDLVHINADADNRSSQNLEGSVPFYILWMDNIINNREDPHYLTNSARNLLKKFVILNYLGALIARDRGSTRKFRNLHISKELSLRILFLLLEMVPVKFLKIIRNSRYPKA